MSMSPTTIVRPPRAPSLDVLLSLPPAQYTRLCCFCIPARVALFITAAVLFILSTSFVTVGWVIVNKLNDYVTDLQRLSIVFHIFIYIVLAAFCIFGIFSAFSKDVKLPSLFTSFILGQLLFGWGSGAVCLYVLFTPSTALQNIGSCSSIVDDQFLKLLCERAPVFKGLAVAFFVSTWILEILAIYASCQYTRQLHEEAVRLEVLEPKGDRDSFYV